MCEISVSNAKAILPWVALDEVGGVTQSASVDLGGVANEFTMQVTVDGSPTGLDLALQGSNDNVNWLTLFSNPNGGSHFASTGSSNKHYVRYVRVALKQLTGGTSPKVSVAVAVGRVI